MTSIIQLNPNIEVSTPLGVGLALLVIDYSPLMNTCWIVAMANNGQIKHFDSNQVKVVTNFTYSFNIPIKKGKK